MANGVILLVEDNPDDVELTMRSFEQANIGNEVVVARDGVEALDYLWRRDAWSERGPEQYPAVVLLDIQLPKIDGLEVLEQIRRDPRTRRTPVVMLTSSNEERDLVQSYERGANSFVRKPVDFDRFAEAVRQLGLYWLVINEPAPPTGADAR
ncbi:MAG: response regulator [Armatimonadota bacterium]